MMKPALTQSVTLNNGVKMPILGFGVWKTKDGDEVFHAVKHAIQSGYRLIDTAAVYRNEGGVGEAIKASGVSRDELFVTTKVYNDQQGYDETLKAFEGSLEKLQMDEIDLYLIHWPVKEKFKDTWKAMERIYKEGRAKAIGVCNFHIHHLERLLEDAEVVPAVNQVEFHPLLTQRELLKYCREKGIQLEAWSPLMHGNLHEVDLSDLAAKYGKTPAQIILRWDIQQGVVTIPKSVTPSRIEENSQIFDFELSEEDMDKMTALNQDRRFGRDPRSFD